MSELFHNFKFFVPVDLEKAKDKKGNEVMKIGGIASTPHKDDDNEFLNPKGFDLSYFLDSGFLNWNHRSKDEPGAIVGEPTSAFVDDKDYLHIEGELYNDSQKAKDIYSLAKALQESGSKRRLGFSIEGQVLDRDPLDQRKVTKAKITGCAITPSPKNHYTLADIVKGNYREEEYKYDPEPRDLEPTTNQLGGITDNPVANGGQSYIVDITQNGIRTTVDERFNILIRKEEKAMVAGTETGTETLNQETHGPSLKLESVEGSRERGKDKKNKKKKTKSMKNLKKLTKAEVYSEIFSYFYGIDKPIDYNSANLVYDYLDRFSKTIYPEMNNNSDTITITKGDLSKAFANLSKEYSDSDGIKKANDVPLEHENITVENSKPNVPDNAPGQYYERMWGKGGYMEDKEKAYGKYSDMDDEEYEKTKKAKEKDHKAMEDDLKEMEKYRKKGKYAKKGNDNEFSEEAVSAIMGKVETILKGHNESLEGKLSSVATLFQGAYDKFDNIEKGISDITERVDDLESTPLPKSIKKSGFVDRKFDESGLEKGNNDTYSLSNPQHKQALLDIMEEKCNLNKGAENIDNYWVDALSKLEVSNHLDQNVAARLLRESGVRVTQ